MSEGSESRETPKELFHGTSIAGITEFEPRVSGGSGEADGAQVFASNDKIGASIMMASGIVRTSWSAGKINGTWFAVIPLARDAFEARDNGGYLYTLPGDTFQKNTRGFGENEFKSSVPVKPCKEEYVPSVLKEMLRLGVSIYFLSAEEYAEYRKFKGDPSQFLMTKKRATL